MTFRDDERGAFQAFEAILVAIMIASAILYVTATSNPVLETTGAGIDLTPEAQAAAFQMATTYELDFRDAINISLTGGGGDAKWEYLVGQTLDDDFRHAVQIGNGISAMQLTPAPGQVLSQPRGAVQGTAYVRADWIGPDEGRTTYAVGQPIGISMTDPGLLYYQMYHGGVFAGESSTGPGGIPWLTLWDMLAANPGEVPASAPLGKWRYDGTNFEVVALNGTEHVEFPAVAVQLLIWDGAA